MSKFTFEQDGLGQWQWFMKGETPIDNRNSQTGFPTKAKAQKNAKRYGYEPSESDSDPGEDAPKAKEATIKAKGKAGKSNTETGSSSASQTPTESAASAASTTAPNVKTETPR